MESFKNTFNLLICTCLLLSCNYKRASEFVDSFYAIQSDTLLVLEKVYADSADYLNHIGRMSVVPLPVELMFPLDEPHVFRNKNTLIFLDNNHAQLQIVSLSNDSLLLKKNLLGRGHGEVVFVSNSFIEKDTLYIFDGQKLNCYNTDGTFIGTINRQEFEMADKVFKINNKYYAITHHNRNLIKVINNEGKILSKLLNMPKFWNIYWTGRSDNMDFYVRDGSLHFFLHYDFRLFGLTNSDLGCLFQIKSDELITYDDIQDITEDDTEFITDHFLKLNSMDKYRSFNRFIETDSYYIFDLYKSDYAKSYIISKNNNRISVLDYNGNDNFLPFLWYSLNFSGSDGDNIYALIGYSDFKYIIKRYPQDPLSMVLADQLNQLYDGTKVQDDDMILLSCEISD